jgi:hypothetical protein
MPATTAGGKGSMSITLGIKKPVTHPRRRPVKLDDDEKKRLEQLRKEVEPLPSLDGPPPESAAAALWLGFRRRVRQLLTSEDARRFLEWDAISQTMHAGNAPYIAQELNALKDSPQWQSRWKPALREDAAGCPNRSRWRPTSSGNLIHHVYHLHKAEPVLRRQIENFSHIIEFGGGYGSFCRLAWRLGFRGRYVIFDFPEFSALQRYFLRSVGVPLAQPGKPNGAHCITEMDDLVAEARDCELFLGLWSISETPLDFRRKVLATVANAGNFLFASQRQVGEVDNIAFFKQWTAMHSQLQWSELPIAHMPDSYYLIGR